MNYEDKNEYIKVVSIWETIKKFRQSKGMTQKQLADKCGLAPITIRQYESGKREPNLETIRKIATALEVSISDLVVDWAMLSRDEIIKDWDTEKKEQENIKNIRDKQLINNFNKLNDTGQKEVLKRVEELTEIPKYRKSVIDLFAGIEAIKKDMGLDSDISTVIELKNDDEEDQD